MKSITKLSLSSSFGGSIKYIDERRLKKEIKIVKKFNKFIIFEGS